MPSKSIPGNAKWKNGDNPVATGLWKLRLGAGVVRRYNPAAFCREIAQLRAPGPLKVELPTAEAGTGEMTWVEFAALWS
jgi:hypothetical protein